MSRDHRERFLTYLITFSCYGHHLHGDASGSVDRNHNRFGGRLVTEDRGRLRAERQLMDQPPYLLDPCRREVVLNALVERCAERRWTLFAAHVRSNHVHLVVEGDAAPERIMNDLKSFGSRCLNQTGLDEHDRKRWARHGSTRWLWDRDSVAAAVRYVIEEQGGPMALRVTAP